MSCPQELSDSCTALHDAYAALNDCWILWMHPHLLLPIVMCWISIVAIDPSERYELVCQSLRVQHLEKIPYARWEKYS